MYRKATRLRKPASAFVASVAMLLAACPQSVRQPEAPRPAAPDPAVPELRGAAVYEIDSNASDVEVFVYRGGPLARLGHNHVVTARSVSGRAWLQPQFTRSGFELSFPVAELIVDDPAARSAAGADFRTQISQGVRDGTRANMLGPDVLDAQRYPRIALRSVSVEGDPQTAQLTARVTIRDVSRDVPMPATISANAERITAAGEFDLLQTDFGIRPFSVGLGSLQVQDRLHVRFQIVAVRAAQATAASEKPSGL